MDCAERGDTESIDKPRRQTELFTNSWLVERVGGVGNRRAGSSGSSSDGATV